MGENELNLNVVKVHITLSLTTNISAAPAELKAQANYGNERTSFKILEFGENFHKCQTTDYAHRRILRGLNT